MPILISQHFGIESERFTATGAFDGFLDVDTQLFIDPALLPHTMTPELAASSEGLRRRFREVIKLLTHSKAPGDPFWKAAEKRLTFPEVSGLSFGYSKQGTAGSGMGPGLRSELLKTAQDMIQAGIQDPEIFELVGLFQEGIGADRIGDMTAGIIRGDLETFTRRVFDELRVPSAGHPLTNPYNRDRPILLVPMDILSELPVAYSYDDIDRIVLENEELRARLNPIIGSEWKDFSKRDLRELLLRDPDLFRQLISAYKNSDPKAYDFEGDPAGQITWFTKGQQVASQNPLLLKLQPEPSLEEVESVVTQICEQFRILIEDKGLNKSLYGHDGNPLKEAYIQRLFFAVADAHCGANNLDISPEANSGRGPVDFKFSRGYELRVIVEVKKSIHSDVVRGMRTQLPIYQKQEGALRAIYLVVDVGATSEKLNSIREAFEQVPKPLFRLMIVDGIVYPSASKI